METNYNNIIDNITIKERVKEDKKQLAFKMNNETFNRLDLYILKKKQEGFKFKKSDLLESIIIAFLDNEENKEL